MDDDTAIQVKNVYKNFRLPHEKDMTVKSALISTLRGKKSRTVTTQHALKDISFEIKKGEFFGIVGRNGSGKSTLLKILAGIYQPTQGSVLVRGRLVPFIELGVGFNPELTGRENVYLNGALLGFSKDEVTSMYDEIVKFAELEKFMDQKLKNYSSGMQVRLAFSMAIRAEADILLVDEVLAVGDADFQRKCFAYFKKLKREKKTVVFVSHDMNAVREYCDRAIMINDSQLVHEGKPEQIAVHYTKLFTQTGATNETGKAQNRWGDGAAKFLKTEVLPKKISGETEQLTIKTTIKFHEDMSDPIFGFRLKDATNSVITGTNTRILHQEVGSYKAGDNIAVEWKIPNVFADGTYYIDPAIVRSDGIGICDWWEEAATFTSYKDQHSPYMIDPPIDVNITQA